MHLALFYLPIISVLVINVARIMELRTPRDLVDGEVRSSATLRLFFVVGSLIFLCSIAEYLFVSRGANWLLFGVGWTCALVSFAIRRRAIAALGRFWSLQVEIRAEHEFVRSGPFRFMRHPAYFSMILELLALALICNARWTMLLVPLLFVPVLLQRVRLEETALLDKFREAYREYQRTTPALFPRVW